MSRLDAALEPSKNGGMRAHISALPTAVAERLAARGLEGSLKIAFEEPPPSGAEMVARSHPLTATLAEILARRRARSEFQPSAVARPGWRLANTLGQDRNHRGAVEIAVQADCPRP